MSRRFTVAEKVAAVAATYTALVQELHVGEPTSPSVFAIPVQVELLRIASVISMSADTSDLGLLAQHPSREVGVAPPPDEQPAEEDTDAGDG